MTCKLHKSNFKQTLQISDIIALSQCDNVPCVFVKHDNHVETMNARVVVSDNRILMLFKKRK